MSSWPALRALWGRELLRFYRDRSRIVGALLPPIVFWFLIGSGLGSSFHLPAPGVSGAGVPPPWETGRGLPAPGVSGAGVPPPWETGRGLPGASPELDFLQYFFAGTLVLIVLFTSVFSTISLIEDRREGFLQAVLVAPLPRLSLALGKVLGASTVGFLQGMTFLILAPAAGLEAPAWGYAVAALALALASLGLTGLGFCIAWRLDSTQGFHAVMNLFLIPMWMLSGALFPVSTAPPWLRAVIKANPMTYAVSALQQALSPGHPALAQTAGLPACLLILAAFALAMAAAAAWVASGRSAAH